MNTLIIAAGFFLLLLFAYSGYKDLQEPEPIPEEYHEEPPQEPPQEKVLSREQLEKAAADCLYLMGAKFDLWSFCRHKSNIELMDIITRYNLDN